MGMGAYLLNVRKLNNIGRWANEFLHRRTSVAEHSFSVAQIAQMLGLIEEHQGQKVDWKRLYRKSLNHDVPEALMGDVISTTKNLNPQVKKAMDIVEEELINILLSDIPAEYKGEFTEMIKDAKDETLEGKILTAADQIDALIECLQEIELSNSEPFTQKYQEIIKRIEQSTLSSVQYFMKVILPYFKEKSRIVE